MSLGMDLSVSHIPGSSYESYEIHTGKSAFCLDLSIPAVEAYFGGKMLEMCQTLNGGIHTDSNLQNFFWLYFSGRVDNVSSSLTLFK